MTNDSDIGTKNNSQSKHTKHAHRIQQGKLYVWENPNEDLYDSNKHKNVNREDVTNDSSSVVGRPFISDVSKLSLGSDNNKENEHPKEIMEVKSSSS